jgi:hypothetical protein
MTHLYTVHWRGDAVLKTDDIDEARQKLTSLGSTAYIQYNEEAREKYAAENDPHQGERE